MATGTSSIPILDYIVFLLVLLISLIIGIFFSFRQKSTEEYIHGSRSLGVIPVSISMVVSSVSAITLQGLPAELYLYGLDVTFIIFSQFGIWLVIVTFLPIYYDLKYSSIFQYLEERYRSKTPKILANILSLWYLSMYAGITILGPATAMESLTGIPTVYNIITMAVVCTIYTSFGGIRAVIWTDVFQAIIMLGGVCIIIIVGFSKLGLYAVWYELEKNGYTTLNFNPDITQRSSIWTFSILLSVIKFQIFISQSSMVRYTGLPNINKARLSILVGSIGFMLIQTLALLVGIVVFAYYSQLGCGPLGAGKINSPNQIIPYFVIDVVKIPGLPGVFMSALVASSLSSVSSAQNSFAVNIWKDILSHFLPEITDFKKTVVLKVMSGLFGLISMAIALAAMFMGDTLMLLSALTLGVVGSPIMAMFIIGASCSFVSSFSAITGCLSSIAFLSWLTIGKFIYGTLWVKPRIISETCSNILMENLTNFENFTTQQGSDYIYEENASYTTANMTLTTTYVEEYQPSLALLKFYSITPFAYPAIGTVTSVTIALLLSIIPCFRHRFRVNPKLLFPFVRRFIKHPEPKRYAAEMGSEKEQPLLMTIST